MSEASDRDLLAAEYVLGTLEGEEAQEAARLLASDAVFATAVRGWEERLAPIAAGVSPVAPPPQLWDRIAAATMQSAPATTQSAPTSSAPMSSTPGSTASVSAASVSTAPASSATAQSAVAPQTVTLDTTAAVIPLAFRRRMRIWQASTGIALAVAASLAAFVVLRPTPPSQIAVLAPTTGRVPVLLATAEPNGVLNVRPDGTIAVPSDRDLELWALAAGETQPRSLGVLPARGRRLVAAVTPGTQLMVSLEPRGGSPTGQPTGPVLYGGRITTLE